jgi:hypothetical protein
VISPIYFFSGREATNILSFLEKEIGTMSVSFQNGYPNHPAIQKMRFNRSFISSQMLGSLDFLQSYFKSQRLLTFSITWIPHCL